MGRDPRRPSTEQTSPARAKGIVDSRWGVLCYIAGDLGVKEADSLRRDVEELTEAASAATFPVAFQYDDGVGVSRGGNGAARTAQTSDEELSRDSAATRTFDDFLRWGLSVVDADQIVLVVRGEAVRALYEGADPKLARFTLCHDVSAGSSMTGAALARVVCKVLAELTTASGERSARACERKIALLAIDTSHAQFLELAYELDGSVDVLLASQTRSLREGWDYERLVSAIDGALAEAPGPLEVSDLACRLVDALFDGARAYRGTDYAISALDLRCLDDVARAFDSLCVGTIQNLGEKAIWEARQLLRAVGEPERGARDAATTASWWYDAGSFLAMFAESLDAVADASAELWLASLLRSAEPDELKFCRKRAWAQLQAAWSDHPRQALWKAALVEADATAVTQAERHLGQALHVRMRALEGPRTRTTRAKKRPGHSAAKRFEAALRGLLPLLRPERRMHFEQAVASARTARVLANQARLAGEQLLGAAWPAEDRPACAAGAKRTSQRQPPARGLVLACRSRGPQQQGWPRYSGVSLYRPPELDDLMTTTAYAEFAFHRRIHWSAMLGAANLIDEHPTALWRLVSSLLATGSASTRRDVLRRLSGEDSVVWGLRDQFRSMVPAPMLSLSLEPHASGEEPSTGGSASQHPARYLVRLEAADGGAIVAEQQSPVHPELLHRALEQMRTLPQNGGATPATVRKLRSVGAMLAEDILQTLNQELNRERERALALGESAALHLQLQIPIGLMQYPWELMQQNGAWLGERFAVGRQVFVRAGAARRVSRRSQGKLRVLVIGDPQLQADLGFAQLEGARREAMQVVACFEAMSEEFGELIDFDAGRDAYIHVHLTGADLRQLLRDGRYDVVHFAGHGAYRASNPLESCWVLSDGPLTALSLANTLRETASPPWLVYGNACEAAMDGAPATYHQNVFGLASAFIQHGVASYIAPLWQIEDLLAQQIAISFYERLVRERRTVGEALRRAKLETRLSTVPDHLRDDEPIAGLGWASLILYGDPTEELFHAVAGRGNAWSELSPQRKPTKPLARPSGAGAVSVPSASAHPTPLLHAPSPELLACLDTPSERVRRAQRGALDLPKEPGHDAGMLSLIEVDGVRRFSWRRGEVSRSARSVGALDDGLPGSPFPALMRDPRLRSGIGGQRGLPRVIGRWIVKKLAGDNTSLIEEYDRDRVPHEGVMWVAFDGRLQPLSEHARAFADGASNGGGRQRVLLLVHGTFSRSAAPIAALGPEFLRWAHENYRGVLAFDHWTLSKRPDQNADFLANQLSMLAPELLRGRQIDVISHSRGGLLARAFCELKPEHANAVCKLVYVATPNCGTDLANPANWGMAADLLVNMTALRGARLFGRLAGLLARYAVQEGEKNIPGLLAQKPVDGDDPSSFLSKLQKPSPQMAQVTQYAVASEFEPPPLTLSLRRLLAVLGDGAADTFYRVANDLVVNTSHVWCIDQQRPANGQTPPPLPSVLPPERLLLFAPTRPSIEVPPGCVHKVALGVHHNNLFEEAATRSQLRVWLSS